MSDPVMLIRFANSIKDVLGVCKLDTNFSSSKQKEKKFDVRACTTDDLDSVDREELFALYETNMKDHYTANGGWKPAEKRNEIFDSLSRFLLVYSSPAPVDTTTRRRILAFSVYKMEWDDEDEPEFPVLYCYELQVCSSLQGHSIGEQLMNMLIVISDKLKMWKVMLTCFVSNPRALKFYRGLGFDTDCNSPIAHGFPANYEILSNRPNLRSS